MSSKLTGQAPRPDRCAGIQDADIIAACRNLHSAIDALDHRAAEALGITRNDLRCLNLLEFGPVSPKRIASQLGLTTGAVTALVDRLERNALVQRSRDLDDRRSVIVAATPLVFQKLGPIYRAYADALIAITSAYAEKEKHDACRHLNDARQACEAAIVAVNATLS